MVNHQREAPANWTIWVEKEQPDANGKGRRWKMKCSCCLSELEAGVVFPEHGLRLCLSCVARIHERAINNVPSGDHTAGQASDSVPRPSRDNTPKEV